MVRGMFHAAVLEPDKSSEFHSYIRDHQGEEPTIKAYKAVAEALVAQTLWNPITKYAHVQRYQQEMEKVMQLDGENLEIRFLRFAVEFYLPRFLMMSNHLEEDRDFLVENLASIDSLELDDNFARYIVYFMNETGMVDHGRMSQIEASFSNNLSEPSK